MVIDAGHGGEDGGASSKSGVLESAINLEIAGITNDLLRFAGVRTVMVRTQDVSVYTDGGSIQQKKVSDLKNRVKLVESTPNALLLSIHQNFFPEAQVPRRAGILRENARKRGLGRRHAGRAPCLRRL